MNIGSLLQQKEIKRRPIFRSNTWTATPRTWLTRREDVHLERKASLCSRYQFHGQVELGTTKVAQAFGTTQLCYLGEKFTNAKLKRHEGQTSHQTTLALSEPSLHNDKGVDTTCGQIAMDSLSNLQAHFAMLHLLPTNDCSGHTILFSLGLSHH